MKNKKLILTTSFTTLGTLGVLVPAITVPLVVNKNNDIQEKLIDSYKNIFNADAKQNIENLFFSNSNGRMNTNITKNEIKEAIHFDKTTFLYKELKNLNPKIDLLDDELATEIYEEYLVYKEEQEKNPNLRCGKPIISKHWWLTIYMRGRALAVNVLSVLWWAVQIAPGVAEFVTSLNGAALDDALAGFDHRLPDFFQPLLISTVKTIKDFKQKTKCKSKFWIWTQGIYI